MRIDFGRIFPHARDWHDATQNVRRGMTPTGDSLMSYGGSGIYLAANVDSYFPTFYTVRADSWYDAFEIAMGDRTVPACDHDYDPDDETCPDCESWDWSDDRGEFVDSVALSVWGPIYGEGRDE